MHLQAHEVDRNGYGIAHEGRFRSSCKYIGIAVYRMLEMTLRGDEHDRGVSFDVNIEMIPGGKAAELLKLSKLTSAT